jgi:hypothetical protein
MSCHCCRRRRRRRRRRCCCCCCCCCRKVLPPITDGLPTGGTQELGSVVAHKGKYYMLFGGGRLYVSDSPTSGFQLDANNPDFHTDGDGVYFTRLWNVQPTPSSAGDGSNTSADNSTSAAAVSDDTILVTHQWAAFGYRTEPIYLAPVKEAIVGADGTLRVAYWPGNEKLKGDLIDLTKPPAPVPPTPAPAPSKCFIDSVGGISYVGGNIFGNHHLVNTSATASACCAMCEQYSKATPTHAACVFIQWDSVPCYGNPGPCCRLKASVAWAGRTTGGPPTATTASILPLPSPPGPPTPPTPPPTPPPSPAYNSSFFPALLNMEVGVVVEAVVSCAGSSAGANILAGLGE